MYLFFICFQSNELYCQFPPSGSHSISVQTEDYLLLEDETFLNDVIIDFFFKWLQYDQVSAI
jgi:Ulp1 family protease